MFILFTSSHSQSDLPRSQQGQQGQRLEHGSRVFLYGEHSAGWKEGEGISSVTPGVTAPPCTHTHTDSSACLWSSDSLPSRRRQFWSVGLFVFCFFLFYRCFSEPAKQQLGKYRRMTHQAPRGRAPTSAHAQTSLQAVHHHVALSLQELMLRLLQPETPNGTGRPPRSLGGGREGGRALSSLEHRQRSPSVVPGYI